MQAANLRRLLWRVLAQHPQFLIQGTKQILFATGKKGQGREQSSDSDQHNEPSQDATRLRQACQAIADQTRSATMARADSTTQAIPTQETPRTMVLARLAWEKVRKVLLTAGGKLMLMHTCHQKSIGLHQEARPARAMRKVQRVNEAAAVAPNSRSSI